MPKGECFVQKVAGLSADIAVGATGYLYACQSRAGNSALWKHMFENVVVPEIKRCSQLYSGSDEVWCGHQL